MKIETLDQAYLFLSHLVDDLGVCHPDDMSYYIEDRQQAEYNKRLNQAFNIFEKHGIDLYEYYYNLIAK